MKYRRMWSVVTVDDVTTRVSQLWSEERAALLCAMRHWHVRPVEYRGHNVDQLLDRLDELNEEGEARVEGSTLVWFKRVSVVMQMVPVVTADADDLNSAPTDTEALRIEETEGR